MVWCRGLFIISLLLLCSLSVSAQTTTFTPICAGSNDTARFTAIITAIGANAGTIRLPYKKSTTGSRCAVNNLTIPANVTLSNEDGTGLKINTGQALTVVGPVISPPKLFFANALSGQGTVSFAGNKVVTYVYPEYWGGGAGVAAATNAAALNAANVALMTISSGEIKLGPGTYDFDATITLGNNSVGAFTGIDLRGTNGLVGTKLLYSGTGDAIKLTNGRFNHLSDFLLEKSGSRGTSRGLVLTGPGGGGAFTFWTDIERVSVRYFHIGIENGNTTSGADADLVRFHQGGVSDCNIGLKVTGANSTQIQAFNFGVARCSTYGVYITEQGGNIISWYGGSFGGNVVSVFNDASTGNLHFEGIRDEFPTTDPNYQFYRGEVFTANLKITNYVMAGVPTAPLNYPIISSNGGMVEISNSDFAYSTLRATPFGPSTASAQKANLLTIRNCRVNENAQLFTSNGNSAGMLYKLESNNKVTDAGDFNGKWDDEDGVIESLTGNGLRSGKITVNTPTSAAISSAISRLNSGEIHLLPATYSITAKTSLTKPDLKFIGSGASTVLSFTLNDSVFELNASADRTEFRDIKFVGNFTGTFNNQHAITANPTPDDLTIRNCIFESVVGPIFVGNNGSRYKINDNLFLLNGADIQFGSGVRTAIEIARNRFTGSVSLTRDDVIALSGCNSDVLVEGNWVDNAGTFASGLLHGEGVLIEASESGCTPKKIKIINNVFKNMPSSHASAGSVAGINVTSNSGGLDPEDVLIANNTIENVNTGILIQNAGTGLIISKNTVRTTAATYNAIFASTTGAGMLVDGNQIYGASNHGIGISNPARPRIVNNFISGAGTHGIVVVGTSDNPIIGENTIVSAVFDGIQCATANAIIANNQVLSSGRYGINVASSTNPYLVTNKILNSVTSATNGYTATSSNLRGSVTFATAATAAVTFAAAEPDTSYFVAISGSIGESFFVTSKTTSGFTLNSSNASSTAVINWILVR